MKQKIVLVFMILSLVLVSPLVFAEGETSDPLPIETAFTATQILALQERVRENYMALSCIAASDNGRMKVHLIGTSVIEEVLREQLDLMNYEGLINLYDYYIHEIAFCDPSSVDVSYFFMSWPDNYMYDMYLLDQVYDTLNANFFYFENFDVVSRTPELGELSDEELTITEFYVVSLMLLVKENPENLRWLTREQLSVIMYTEPELLTEIFVELPANQQLDILLTYFERNIDFGGALAFSELSTCDSNWNHYSAEDANSYGLSYNDLSSAGSNCITAFEKELFFPQTEDAVLGPLSKQIKFSSSGFSELGKTDTAYVFVNSIDYGLALVAYDWSEGGSEDEFIELVSHNLNTGSIDKIRYIYLGLENMPLEYARLRHSEGQHLIYSYSKADDVLLEFGLFYPVFT